MTTSIKAAGTSIVILLFLVEFIIDQKEKKHLYKKNETMTNILLGSGALHIGLISKSLILFAFELAYSLSPFKIQTGVSTFVIAFILTDLSYYWYHRVSHTVNWFWASHSVHHSADHFNFSISARQSWTQQFSGEFLFWMWLPFIGFEPVLILNCFLLGNIYQSWLHTELIGKLHPAFEYLFNSPSHHRVHHSSNEKYLDKNHGGVFILWDRIFGTFAEEDEKPVYGLTEKQNKNDFLSVLTGEWRSIFQRSARSGSFRNALKYLIMPPGWSADGSSKTVREMRNTMD